MKQVIFVKPNTYYDSVTLMSISQRVQRLEGIEAAMIGMATPLNLEVLQNLGFSEEVSAGPNDLIFALRGEGDIDKALKEAERMLTEGGKTGAKGGGPVRTLEQALAKQEANLALISIPGAFACREAIRALNLGLNVMLFSDNVSLQEEVELKQLAHSKGLLVMGPDCGTAIINGVPLAFANVVNRGNIGIVGASGTGLQEVTVQIDRRGGGISQVIGTGGRDLSSEVGGIMMLDGIEALQQDEDTKVIVVVSKPAAPEVAKKVHGALESCGKPAVYYVIGDKGSSEDKAVVRAQNLLDTARKAVIAAGGNPDIDQELTEDLAAKAVQQLEPGRKYVRGLYSGGTLCDEAMEILTEQLGLIHSNSPLDSAGKLQDANLSLRHTVLDLGDDQFTVGRPHPMIDYSLRLSRLLEEAGDPETALILVDVVLGYGSHPDPASELVPVIRQALAEGKGPIIAAYVCGTDKDPQNYRKQVQALVEAGVQVFPSNVEAARFAALMAKGLEGGKENGK